MNSESFSFQLWRKEIVGYSLETLKCDFFAGLQVALLTLPQSMAYALVAGLPLSAGLFAAIFSSLLALFFSSSRFLIAGPINTIAIMIQTSVAEILYSHFRDIHEAAVPFLSLAIVVQIAFLVGLFQCLVAIFKLGKLTQFISQPVMRGYLAGTMFAVLFNQMFPFFGVASDFDSTSLYERGNELLSRLHLIDPATFMVGGLSLFLLVLIRRIDIRLPAGLITIILATSVVFFFNETLESPEFASVALVGETSERATLIPEISFPDFSFKWLNQLVPIAFAIALLGIVETTFTAKSIGVMSGQRVLINQEILSIGLGNILSSFLSAMPIAVSPVRSSLNVHYGAKTRLSGFFNVFSVLSLVTVFAFFVNLIPLATLSAIIFITALNLINIKQTVLCLRATPQDRFVLMATFFACLSLLSMWLFISV